MILELIHNACPPSPPWPSSPFLGEGREGDACGACQPGGYKAADGAAAVPRRIPYKHLAAAADAAILSLREQPSQRGASIPAMQGLAAAAHALARCVQERTAASTARA